MASIAIAGINHSFGKVPVLRDVTLPVADGEFLSLVGPSGCGKSTLLRIVAGLERQDAGTIHIDGDCVDELPAARRNLAMVFQSYALYPHLTVRQNIAVPLRMRRLSTAGRLPGARLLSGHVRQVERIIDGEVNRVADLLGLRELLGRRPAQLSGGQRQRVAVGRALVREPCAFLLDEPLSNLDATLRVHMRTEIAELHQRLGATFVHVTHDQAEAMTMSDRIAVMFDGQIVQVDPPERLYDDPHDLRVAQFIGSPAINLLPGVIDTGAIVCCGMRVPAHVNAPVGMRITVGVRPEALRIDTRTTQPMMARLTRIENLGSELLAHARVDGAGAPVIFRLDRGSGFPVPDSRGVALSFAAGDMRLFDSNGRRIRHLVPDLAGGTSPVQVIRTHAAEQFHA